MTCVRCGAEAHGNFCSECGASLQPRACPSCGARGSAGARFCTSCGTSLREDPSRGGTTPAARAGSRGDLGWWIAGGLLVVVLVLVAGPILRNGDGGTAPEPGAPQGGGPPAGGGMGAAPQVDLSEMTAIEAADRLFDRVMRAAEAGDDQEVQRFLPMALDAYGLAEPLDADGHFHLSLLQQLAGEPETALDTAESALEDDPNHILNLSAAAQAAAELGDTAAAEGYFRHLLDVFDDEVERDLPEYREHAPLLPTIREEAEEFVANGSG